ncbi:hypothetical protein BGZ46_008302 [Entomortierella lignicola]|nr:hypothetical protein BGZ46_008302 [Entomortierella lignicola]
MPILSLSNLRNRATLIAMLLLLESMAIFWMRDSTPIGSEGSRVRRSLYNPGSSHDRHHAQDNLSYRQQMQHNEHIDLGARAGSVAESGAFINEEKGSHSRHLQAGQATESLEKSLPSTSTSSVPKLPSKDINSKSEKNIKKHRAAKTQKSKKQQQPRRHPAHEKNQRGGFKSTEERKLAQLMPVMDEHGAAIEDHFISPRDTDGDGIPDMYVLLRPTANSKYMLDMGLFDDEVVPAPAPASAAAVAPAALKPAIVAIPAAASTRTSGTTQFGTNA